MIYALVDKDSRATTRSGSVCPVANVVRELRARSATRWVSLRRHMSKPWSLRSCSNSNFLPRTPSAYQHASRRALPGVPLGRAAMLSQEKNNGFEDGSRASVTYREGRGRGEQTACQLYAGRGGKVVEEVGDPHEW
jgi:hypothetical protein